MTEDERDIRGGEMAGGGVVGGDDISNTLIDTNKKEIEVELPELTRGLMPRRSVFSPEFEYYLSLAEDERGLGAVAVKFDLTINEVREQAKREKWVQRMNRARAAAVAEIAKSMEGRYAAVTKAQLAAVQKARRLALEKLREPSMEFKDAESAVAALAKMIPLEREILGMDKSNADENVVQTTVTRLLKINEDGQPTAASETITIRDGGRSDQSSEGFGGEEEGADGFAS